MYKALDINRENLTIMGIEFPDLKSLESAANAIGSNVFEGFEPTSELVQLYIDLKIQLKLDIAMFNFILI
jgi:putative transcriptional regulator